MKLIKCLFLAIFIGVLFENGFSQEEQLRYLPINNNYFSLQSNGNITIGQLPTPNSNYSQFLNNLDAIEEILNVTSELDDAYYGQPPAYAQTIVYDSQSNDNQILFFIVDNHIYNRFGYSFQNTGSYSNLHDIQRIPGPYGELMTSEIAVVPVPGQCYQYYIIYGIQKSISKPFDFHLYYRTLTFYDDNTIDLSSESSIVNVTNSSVQYTLSFGVSPFRKNTQDYKLFLVIGNNIGAATINSSGITQPSYYEYLLEYIPSQGGYNHYPCTEGNGELEILPILDDGSQYLIGFSSKNRGNYYIFLERFINGLFEPSTYKLESPGYVSGIEFSPIEKTNMSARMFFNYLGQDQMYYHDVGFAIQGLTPTAGDLNLLNTHFDIPDDPSKYDDSQIERGRDGKIYYINKGSNVNEIGITDPSDYDGYISRLNNPVDLTGWETHVGGINNIASADISGGNIPKFIFADQIDFGSYDEYYETVSSECCLAHYKYDEPDLSNYPYIGYNYSTGDMTIQTDSGSHYWHTASNPFNNQSVIHLKGNLTIEPGANLFADHLTFKFAEGKSLIINSDPNSNNVSEFDHCVLTSNDACGLRSTWQGIVFNGNGTQYSSNTGTLHLLYSEVEYAQTAVEDNDGGILYCNNSILKDNVYGIVFNAFTNPAPNQGTNASDIYSNEFITTPELYTLNETPKNFVSVWFNPGKIRIEGNSFDNTASVYYPNVGSIGNGIMEMFSNVELTYATNPLIHNSFAHLNYAIAAIDNDGIMIDNAQFTDNYRGVYLNNCNFPTITHNNFDACNSCFGSFTDIYGLYLDGSSGFFKTYNSANITDNTFHDGRAGMFINNSNNNGNNYIYRNSFTNLESFDDATGLTALHENADASSNYINGLEFGCNKFTHSKYALGLVHGTISKYQGGFNFPANNYFDHYHDGYTDPFIETDFYIGMTPLPTVYYWYTNFNAYKLYDDYDVFGNLTARYYDDKIIQYSVQGSDDYNVNCPDLVPISFTPPVVVSNFTQAIETKKSTAGDMEDELNQKVDNGNTSMMLDEVNGLTPQNYFTTCNDLLQSTPYLSDTVLVTFMRNTLHRPIAKATVLFANSPLPIKAQQEIDNTNLPPFFKWLLWQYQDGIYQRVQDEMAIQETLNEASNLRNQLIADVLQNDTLNLRKDSVIRYLEDYGTTLTENKDRVALYTATADYTNANTLLDNMEQDIMSLPEMLQQETEDYIFLQRLMLTMRQNPRNAPFQIEINYKRLTDLADTVMGKNSSIAGGLLSYYQLQKQSQRDTAYDYVYEETYQLPESDRGGKLPQIGHHDYSQYASQGSDMLNVFPNPANNVLQIEYLNLSKDNQLNIYSLQGQLIKTLPVNKKIGLTTIDVTDMSNGIYILSLGGFNNNYSVKFTVSH